MIDDFQIEIVVDELKKLEERIVDESKFCSMYPNNTNELNLSKEWMNGIISSYNYSQVLIRIFINSIRDFKDLPEEQFHYYVGKIAIQHLLELINKYEQINDKAIRQYNEFENMIFKRIEKKIDQFNKNWINDNKGKTKRIEKEILDNFKLKAREQSFIRDTLLSNNIIDKTDHEILCFAWDIRNSMHKDFNSIKDIDFNYTDFKTGINYHFKYSKGTVLYHPGDLLGFFSISFQIQFIMLKILKHFKRQED